MHDSAAAKAPAARAHAVRRAGHWTGPAADRVVLDYEARFLRRRRLTGAGGTEFVADLPETVSLDAGDAFLLDDGRCVEVAAAAEPVTVVRGDLARLAWHVGNRHTPAQIAADHLVIRRDHVLSGMLLGLGAALEDDIRPFTPEGGAYGHGRTMGHDHGHSHDHSHRHIQHGHDHDHGHSHDHHRHDDHRLSHAHGHTDSHADSHGAGDHSHSGHSDNHAAAPTTAGARG